MKKLTVLDEEDIKALEEQLQKAVVSQDIGQKQFCLRFVARVLEIEIEGGMKKSEEEKESVEPKVCKIRFCELPGPSTIAPILLKQKLLDAGFDLNKPVCQINDLVGRCYIFKQF